MSQKTDCVIPLGKSRTDHLDLKFCLRSLERFGKGLWNIYIIGEKPSWIKNVKHYGYPDLKGEQWKERSIYNKTALACQMPVLSDNFIFTNDDIVLLKEIDLENYPYYTKGTCHESMLKNKSHYRATMNHTKKWLEANGHDDFNADGHCPIIFNKEKFLNTFTDEMWNTPFGYGMKTIYCAKNGVKTEFMQDCKMHTKVTKQEVEQRVQGRHVISFTDAALKSGVREYLEELFPLKSLYEK